MSEPGIVGDLVAAAVAAFLGGMIALSLRQPVILGYLPAGMAIGPYTPGPVSNTHNVQLMAELGVAFLMFALGVEFSPSELLKMRWVAGLGGVLRQGIQGEVGGSDSAGRGIGRDGGSELLGESMLE